MSDLSGANRVTDAGILVPMGEPDITIVFDDPMFPALRTKQFEEIAEGTFQLNGIKFYRAMCDGKRCLLEGWGG